MQKIHWANSLKKKQNKTLGPKVFLFFLNVASYVSKTLQMHETKQTAWRVNVLQYIFLPQGVSRYGFDPLIYFPKFIYIRFVIIHPRNW